MNIALLAWGSLLWKAEPLKIRDPWQWDGPRLPIEFAREGDGGELAVVLCAGAPEIAVPWACLDETDLGVACEQLRIREAIPRSRRDGIGTVSRDQPYVNTFCADVVERWRESKDLDAVVWTALPPRSAGIEGRVPSAGEAVRYLRRLHGEIREHAKQYALNVPACIDTPIRREIKGCLGWSRPEPNDPS